MTNRLKYNINAKIFVLIAAWYFIIVGCISVYGTINGSKENYANDIVRKILILDDITIPIRTIETDTLYDCIISVKNQTDFDHLSTVLPKKIETFNNILIKITGGKFFSKTNHIHFKNINYPDCRISIVGDGNVTIMLTSNNLMDMTEEYQGYKVIRHKHNFNVDPNEIFTDGENAISLSIMNDEINSGVSFVEELFEKICPEDKYDLRYRLRSSLLPDLSAEECKNLWLWATHSWTSSYEKIDSVAKGYIYITVNKDIELYQCPLNTDYKSWKIMPRIKVVNYNPSNLGIFFDNNGILYLPEKYNEIYKCDKGAFVNSVNTRLKSIEISGVKFVGGNSPVIDVNKIEDYAYIHDCEFVSQQRSSIRLKTDRGIVCNNKFRNSMANVIEVSNGFKNHLIHDNTFINCGHRLLNQACIKASADSVLIARNIFRNNLVAAISLGLWHGHQSEGEIFTVVEDNVIYNDESVLKNYMSDSLLDVSLIYCATKNDNAIIRRNRIHGLRTLASGNGIYLDDGAYNVNVYDNIVTGIDGELYNINCRSHINEKAKGNAPEYSTNNFIAKNIVDGLIRYEIRSDSASYNFRKSSYGGNIFLSTTRYSKINNQFENVDSTLDIKYKAKDVSLKINVDTDIYESIMSRSHERCVEFVKTWILN